MAACSSAHIALAIYYYCFNPSRLIDCSGIWLNTRFSQQVFDFFQYIMCMYSHSDWIYELFHLKWKFQFSSKLQFGGGCVTVWWIWGLRWMRNDGGATAREIRATTIHGRKPPPLSSSHSVIFSSSEPLKCYNSVTSSMLLLWSWQLMWQVSEMPFRSGNFLLQYQPKSADDWWWLNKST